METHSEFHLDGCLGLETKSDFAALPKELDMETDVQ
jgi:hypothetical protein